MHVSKEEATSYLLRIQAFIKDIQSEINEDGRITIVSGDPVFGREKKVSGDRLHEAAHLLAYNFMKP